MANPNEKNKSGQNALHQICDSSHPQPVIMEIAERIIAAGVDVNAQDQYGNTPMHYCGKNCYRHVVRMLAMSGAHKSVFIQNKDGLVPQEMVDIRQDVDYDDRLEIKHVFLQLSYAPNLDDDQDDQE